MSHYVLLSRAHQQVSDMQQAKERLATELRSAHGRVESLQSSLSERDSLLAQRVRIPDCLTVPCATKLSVSLLVTGAGNRASGTAGEREGVGEDRGAPERES